MLAAAVARRKNALARRPRILPPLSSAAQALPPVPLLSQTGGWGGCLCLSLYPCRFLLRPIFCLPLAQASGIYRTLVA